MPALRNPPFERPYAQHPASTHRLNRVHEHVHEHLLNLVLLDRDRRQVRLGPISHGLRVIRSGLAGDEQLIISGLQQVKLGSEVAATLQTITPGKESLPDEYEPVPADKWLTPKRGEAANVMAPALTPATREAASAQGKDVLLP